MDGRKTLEARKIKVLGLRNGAREGDTTQGTDLDDRFVLSPWIQSLKNENVDGKLKWKC